jgi:hypothetical protein
MDGSRGGVEDKNINIPGVTAPYGNNIKYFTVPKGLFPDKSQLPVNYVEMVQESCAVKTAASAVMGGFMNIA